MNSVKKVLKYVVCPVCKGKLVLKKEPKETFLHCPKCGLFYPVENGIPALLPEKALTLEEREEET